MLEKRLREFWILGTGSGPEPLCDGGLLVIIDLVRVDVLGCWRLLLMTCIQNNVLHTSIRTVQ